MKQYLLHPKYRADIDGLRAIAILSVVGFHAFPQWIKSGFVGVDIFFVISGFLISSIIFGNLEKNSFSYYDFYARRIKRIFPALILVLATSFIFGWYLLLPDEYKQLGKHTAAGAGFISNFVLWNEAGYFDNTSDTKPLLHLWSLGIEEQFYIFWPLLLGLVWKYRLNFLTITLFIAVVSFSANIFTVASNPVADFYSPLSRFWELMIGGVLAYLTLHKPHHFPKNTNWQSTIGLLLIAVAVMYINKDRAFPGWWALLPTLGAFLIISAQPTAWVNRYLLGNRVMVSIGLISYPLYLWHWPLLVFARIVNFGTPSPQICSVIVAMSFALAGATYLFLEKPIRFSFSVKRSIPSLVVALLFTIIAGLVSMGKNGIPSRFSEKLRSFAAFNTQYDSKVDARVDSCWLSNKAEPSGYSTNCIDEPMADKHLVLLWGDSYAARFFPGLKIVDGGRNRLAQLTRNSCPPIINFRYSNCIKGNTFILGKISMLQPDVVILFGDWEHYPDLDWKYYPDLSFQKLAITIQELNEIGVKKIIVIGPAPAWRNSLPSNLARQAINDGTDFIPARTSSQLEPFSREIDLMLNTQLSAMTNVTYFSALDAMCDVSGCLTTVNGYADGLTTWDYGHLTTAGATYLARKLVEKTANFSTGSK